MSAVAARSFRELVRGVRAESGADADELAMYGAEIDRVRDRLASIVKLQSA